MSPADARAFLARRGGRPFVVRFAAGRGRRQILIPDRADQDLWLQAGRGDDLRVWPGDAAMVWGRWLIVGREAGPRRRELVYVVPLANVEGLEMGGGSHE